MAQVEVGGEVQSHCNIYIRVRVFVISLAEDGRVDHTPEDLLEVADDDVKQ